MRALALLLFSSLAYSLSSDAQLNTQKILTYEEFLEQKELRIQKDGHTPLAMVQRCVAMSTYENTVLSDSQRLVYTHPRGSFASKNAFNVGSAPDTIFNIALNSGVASVKEIWEYLPNNKPLSRTAFENGVQVGNTSFQYGSNENLIEQEAQFDNGVTHRSYQKHTINSEGRLLVDTNYQFAYSPALQNSSNFFYTFKYQYDNQGRETENYQHSSFYNYTVSNRTITRHFYQGNSMKPYLDSIYAYLPDGTVIRSYRKFYYLPGGQILRDTSFNQGGIPNYTVQYSYNGLTTTAISYNYNAGNWINSSKNVSIVNNDGNHVYNEFYHWDQSSGNWIMRNKNESVYNADGYLSDARSQSSNSAGVLQTVRRDLMERNSYNNTYKWTSRSFANGDLSGEVTKYYYYEDYDNGLGIKASGPAIKVDLYPNPAESVLMVNFEQKSSAGTVMKICDMTGKEMVSINDVQQQMAIDISKLAAGNFIFSVHSREGTRLFSQKFLKK